MEQLRDSVYGLDRRKLSILRRGNILLFGFMQLVGGLILYHADTTRGTPLIIENSGVVSMATFSIFLIAFGTAMLIMGLRWLRLVTTPLALFMGLPYLIYVTATGYAVITGQQGSQGAFFYIILTAYYGLVMWGTV